MGGLPAGVLIGPSGLYFVFFIGLAGDLDSGFQMFLVSSCGIPGCLANHSAVGRLFRRQTMAVHLGSGGGFDR